MTLSIEAKGPVHSVLECGGGVTRVSQSNKNTGDLKRSLNGFLSTRSRAVSRPLADLYYEEQEIGVQ